MSEKAPEGGSHRKAVVAGALAGAGALSLPKFLPASDALAAGDQKAIDEAMAVFLGQG